MTDNGLDEYFSDPEVRKRINPDLPGGGVYTNPPPYRNENIPANPGVGFRLPGSGEIVPDPPQVQPIQRTPLPQVAPAMAALATNPLGAQPSLGGIEDFQQGTNKALVNQLMARANLAASEGASSSSPSGPDPALLGSVLSPLLSQEPYLAGGSPLMQETQGGLQGLQAQRMNQPFVDSMTNAIWGQESERGQNTKTSPTGARGQMQIEPGTWKQWAQAGEDIDNPDDNARVGRRIITSYANSYGNDPARVATAYFSGPGNVAPAGSPTPWIKNSSDGKVSVSQYVDQVLSRLSGKSGGGSVPGAGPGQTPGNPSSPSPIGAGIDDQQRAMAKLVLMRMAFPQFHFQNVDYDPWDIQRYAMRGGMT